MGATSTAKAARGSARSADRHADAARLAGASSGQGGPEGRGVGGPAGRPPGRAGRAAGGGGWWTSRVAAGRRLLAQRPWAAVAIIGAFLAVALFHVWSRLAVVELGYRLAAARAAHAALLEQNRRLKLELATLKAPSRLGEVARERFGLMAPLPSQIIHLDAPAPRVAAGAAAPARRASR